MTNFPFLFMNITKLIKKLKQHQTDYNEHQIRNCVFNIRASYDRFMEEPTISNSNRLKRAIRLGHNIIRQGRMEKFLLLLSALLMVLNVFLMMGGSFDKVKIESLPHYYNE